MSTSKPTYVLGTGLSHDGSACLLRDGVIRVAIEKERLTRRKHDGFNDMAAITYCLDAEGIRLADVDLLVQNANFGMFAYGSDWFAGPRDLPASLPIVTISHHLSHAYSAFYASPFDDAAILVIDGAGNPYDECLDLEGVTIPDPPSPGVAHLFCEKDSFYAGTSRGITPLFKDFSPWGLNLRMYPMHPNTTQHSIGGLYLAASHYIFNGFDDAGKLMGLAPYGRPGVYARPIFDLIDGRVFVRYDWMTDFRRPARSADLFTRGFQDYADIAYWVQREVERAVLYVVASRRARHPSDALCYAGGVALNAVANRRIVRESGYREVFIQPAAGDNGLAVGCAYYGWLHVLGRERRHASGTTCFGRTYAAHVCEDACASHARSGEIAVEGPDDYIEEAARLLAEGQVLGWFQGGAEFGPRALGHRSILADPRRAPLRDHINRAIKCREDFRPFAPSVLADEAATYFEVDAPSPYMLLVARVRDEWVARLPSVVHQDQSARIQTVTEEADPVYYALLQAFKRRTGIGVLLNTSLNRRGMPIVETPEEAIDFLITSGLDGLVLGTRLLRKAEAAVAAADETNGHADPMLALEAQVATRLQAINGWVDAPGPVQLTVRHRHAWLVDFTTKRMTSLDGKAVPMTRASIEIDAADLERLLDARRDELRQLVDTGRMTILGDSASALRAARALGLAG